MNRKPILILAILIPSVCLCAAGVYNLPPVHDRLAWRLEELALRVNYALNPPAREVFVPQGFSQSPPPPMVTVITGAPPSAPGGEISAPTAPPVETVVPSMTPAALAEASATPAHTPTVAATPQPLPASIALSGVRYEDQHGRWNYCAPANLAMALTFWGWPGDRDVVGPMLKPVEKDKNVMPYEMVDYVNNQTGLRALMRLGGTHELIKRLIVAGFPVLVEKGTYLRDISGVVSWMGHYQLVTGYNDEEAFFLTQDSYVKADLRETYDEFTDEWRAFNYTYMVVYPAEREADVLALLGTDADEMLNAKNAELRASYEISSLKGIEQYFAWFNRGSNLVKLQDYTGAAQAFDAAFKVYPTIPESERPWRMLWYQTGPYFAYYHTQRYEDVIELADKTLKAMQGDKNLEESYYWRGMARSALGDTQAAVEDFQLAMEYHPGFGPAYLQLQTMGVIAP